MNEKNSKYFMLLGTIAMVAVMFFSFSTNDSSLTSNATQEGWKFSPLLLLLLLCPLMHIFMMRGHGGSCHKQKDEDKDAKKTHMD